MTTSAADGAGLESLSAHFKDIKHLELALTHKSYHHENADSSLGDNERLEFLGDAVLDLILTEILFKKFPEVDEGGLSKIRASLVNETVLSEIALELKLHENVKLGKGEKTSGGEKKPRLLASAFEAVIGALYLDQGFHYTTELVEKILQQRLSVINLNDFYQSDYKTRLQEKIQESHRRTPTYELLREEGPDHIKTFHVRIVVDGKILSEGQGKSKKQAEQDAAKNALDKMQENL